MAALPWRGSVSGNSTTVGFAVFYPDYSVKPFNLGVGVTSTSTSTWVVEHTFDYDPTKSSLFLSTGASSGNGVAGTSTAPIWFAATGLSTYAGANSSLWQGNYAYPVTAIRLNVTSANGTPTTYITIISAG